MQTLPTSLEAKYIAPYLPYGLTLKGAGQTVYEGDLFRLKGMRPDMTYPSGHREYPLQTCKANDPLDTWFRYHHVKPVLRSFDQLGTHIYENGTPVSVAKLIVEILLGTEKPIFPRYDQPKPLAIKEKSRTYSTRSEYALDFKRSKAVGISWVNNRLDFSLWLETQHSVYENSLLSSMMVTGPIVDIQQLLFKYHFDVFGLLEAGLAEPATIVHELLPLYQIPT